MRLAPSRAISSSVSVISPACTEEVSVDSLSMGGVSFPPPASGVFVCWAHAEGYAALFHPIKSRDPQLLRIPPQWAAIQSIAEKIGCSGETLRNWVRQAERDAGKRPGLTTTERERIKELERENR